MENIPTAPKRGNSKGFVSIEIGIASAMLALILLGSSQYFFVARSDLTSANQKYDAWLAISDRLEYALALDYDTAMNTSLLDSLLVENAKQMLINGKVGYRTTTIEEILIPGHHTLNPGGDDDDDDDDGGGPGGGDDDDDDDDGDCHEYVIIMDEDAMDPGISSVENAADDHHVEKDWLVNEDIKSEYGNPWLRWNEYYPGDHVLLPTGELQDEGLFKISATTAWSLAELMEGNIPQHQMDNITDVLPFTNEDIDALVGKTVIAICHTSDVSMNYDPYEANLQGERRGLFRFTVNSAVAPGGLPESGSSSSLKDIWVTVESDEDWAMEDLCIGDPGGGGGDDGGMNPYDFAIFSEDDMKLTGTGTLELGGGMAYSGGLFKLSGSASIEGDVFSTTKIRKTGSTMIYGDATAPVISQVGSGDITGDINETSVSPLSLPVIDYTPYYEWALINEEVYEGDLHYSGSSDLCPTGGVMWVNGDLKINGSGNMNGCFIATGDIKITGSGDQQKVENYPALISINGDIDISGSGRFHGLIYAEKGDFDKSGSGDVTGTIMCKGKFDKSGSWGIMNYENSFPGVPLLFSDDDGNGDSDDSDGDGLDDVWEVFYFDTLNWGALDDNDGDGFNNLQEFLAGTDPTDPFDFPSSGYGLGSGSEADYLIKIKVSFAWSNPLNVSDSTYLYLSPQRNWSW